MKNEIITFLLEDDDEDDVGLGKELTSTAEDIFEPQLAQLLPGAVKKAEKNMRKPCVRVIQHTNPKDETYIFGQFGHSKQSSVMVTLLYLDPVKGWKIYGLMDEDLDDEEDFKEVYGEPTSRYLKLGTVIRGTMQPDDLIPAFIEALSTVSPWKAAKFEERYKRIPPEDKSEYEMDIFSRLVDVLDEYAPPYTYFGCHEGNSSDYGVWPNTYTLDQDIESEETENLQAIKNGEPMPSGSKYVVVVDASGSYEKLLDGSTGKLLWCVESGDSVGLGHSQPDPPQIEALKPALAQAAQGAYDAWEQDEEGMDCELGAGGICQDIAEEMAGVLNENHIEAGTASAQMGEQHVWAVAKLDDGVYIVDIPPGVYETGGGYCWKKRPGVIFNPRHIYVDRVDNDPRKFEEYLADSLQEDKTGIYLKQLDSGRKVYSCKCPVCGTVHGGYRTFAEAERNRKCREHHRKEIEKTKKKIEKIDEPKKEKNIFQNSKPKSPAMGESIVQMILTGTLKGT